MMLGGLPGSGPEGIAGGIDDLSPGTPLFYESGHPAGEVKQQTRGDVRLPDGRSCFDVTAWRGGTKLRVCTAAP